MSDQIEEQRDAPVLMSMSDQAQDDGKNPSSDSTMSSEPLMQVMDLVPRKDPGSMSDWILEKLPLVLMSDRFQEVCEKSLLNELLDWIQRQQQP